MIRGRILLAFTENDIFVVIYIQTFRAIINAGKFTHSFCLSANKYQPTGTLLNSHDIFFSQFLVISYLAQCVISQAAQCIWKKQKGYMGNLDQSYGVTAKLVRYLKIS